MAGSAAEKGVRFDMKKAYSKPGIYVENFALSQSVAAGACGEHDAEHTLGVPTYADKNNCGWQIGSRQYWLNDKNCTTVIGEDVEVDGFCYNNPNGGVTIFAYS